MSTNKNLLPNFIVKMAKTAFNQGAEARARFDGFLRKTLKKHNP